VKTKDVRNIPVGKGLRLPFDNSNLHFQPTGLLTLKIEYHYCDKFNYFWIDSEKRFEDSLNDFIIECAKIGIYQLKRNEENRLYKLELEEQRKIEEANRLQQIRELKKEKHLIKQAKNIAKTMI
jgi:hypothetical protein